MSGVWCPAVENPAPKYMEVASIHDARAGSRGKRKLSPRHTRQDTTDTSVVAGDAHSKSPPLYVVRGYTVPWGKERGISKGRPCSYIFLRFRDD